MIIKVLLLLGMLAIGVLVLRGKTSATTSAVKRMAASLFLVAGMAAVLFPAGVTKVANLVGVGRGADLVLYLVTMSFVFVAIAVYRRISDLENRYVTLARRVAIDEAVGRGPSSSNTATVPASMDTGVSTTDEC